MRLSTGQLALSIGTLLAFPAMTLAHPGHGTEGVVSGMTHPLTGLDHLLAMFAVGLWSSRFGGARACVLPATFLIGMIGGMLLGMAGVEVAGAEIGVAGSLVVFGMLLAIRSRGPLPSAALLTLGFSLFHGYAHGTEIPAAASALGYCLGMVVATAFLHVAGVVIGTALCRRAGDVGMTTLRFGGGAIAACGLAIMTGTL